VDAADPVRRGDRPVDAADQDAQLGGQVRGQIAGIREVLARLEQDTTGRPAGWPGANSRQCSFVQMYSPSCAAQRRQSTPPSPWRGASFSTGGANGLG
jgi:hypothetical protein